MAVLVLDCDGVVVKGHVEGGRWDKHLARDLGVDPDRLLERFFRPYFHRILLGEADLYDVLDAIWPQMKCAASARTFVDYWFAHDSTLDEQVLAAVDGWRTGGGLAFLATTQEHHRARYLMETMALGRRFDGMHYAAALGAVKPDRLFYERTQAQLPVAAPAEVIFLDDSLGNVEAAVAFGWQAAHFRSADDLRAALSGAKP
jgi:putative hydrolase of the HAD superfamily